MKLNRTLPILLIASVSVLFSCKKTNDVQADIQAQTTSAATTDSASSNFDKSLLLKLVNDVRQKGCNCGDTYMAPVEALTWNTELENASQFHASDMSANAFFSHTGFNGSDPGSRIANAGYKWKAYGENIARGFRSEQAVVDGWLKSASHCKNLMNPAFKEIGVAMADNYWVQEFGAK